MKKAYFEIDANVETPSDSREVFTEHGLMQYLPVVKK